jgi:carbonic anhydrase/acetyltransferase-like protein (isoleucine patch superfamily)
MSLYALEGVSPTLPESGRYWVAPNAAVIGKVTLGDEVSVWFGAVLRGDNEPIVLGDRTNIQEHVVIHTDPKFPCVVGPGCTVGHRAILHGCTLGANTLIGMGATVLNGARIGENCLIGAGALVAEGKEIPDNSLVMGMPGKVVREVSEDQIAMIERGVASYVARWKRFKDGLVEV